LKQGHEMEDGTLFEENGIVKDEWFELFGKMLLGWVGLSWMNSGWTVPSIAENWQLVSVDAHQTQFNQINHCHVPRQQIES